MEMRKSGMPCFSCRSLTFSTITLNNIQLYNKTFGKMTNLQTPKIYMCYKRQDCILPVTGLFLGAFLISFLIFWAKWFKLILSDLSIVIKRKSKTLL